MFERFLTVHYWSDNSILVVNQAGKLRILHTPFKVYSITRAGHRRSFTVEAISEDESGRPFYLIGGEYRPHYLYRIEILF
jgi:hypothetical protein